MKVRKSTSIYVDSDSGLCFSVERHGIMLLETDHRPGSLLFLNTAEQMDEMKQTIDKAWEVYQEERGGDK